MYLSGAPVNVIRSAAKRSQAKYQLVPKPASKPSKPVLIAPKRHPAPTVSDFIAATGNSGGGGVAPGGGGGEGGASPLMAEAKAAVAASGFSLSVPVLAMLAVGAFVLLRRR